MRQEWVGDSHTGSGMSRNPVDGTPLPVGMSSVRAAEGWMHSGMWYAGCAQAAEPGLMLYKPAAMMCGSLAESCELRVDAHPRTS